MKDKMHIKRLALGAVLGALIVFTVAAASKGGAAWEYRLMYEYVEPGNANTPPKTPSQSYEQRINAAAAEGWEVTGYAGQVGYQGQSVLLRRAKK